MLIAVEYMHSINIMHRDIKLANAVLLKEFSSEDKTSKIVVKIVDFGTARVVANDKLNKEFVGTHFFLSPEMIKNSGHNTKTDIWSLGVLLFCLRTGLPPFWGKRDRDLYKQILGGYDPGYGQRQTKILQNDKYKCTDDFCDVVREMCTL